MAIDTALAGLSATEAARKIRDGEITSEELAQSCLKRIEELEDLIGAWIHLDKAHVLAQAKAAHEYRQAGGSTGPLHGVPLGIKDIVDTAALPTENGTALQAGRRPGADATLVSLAREAGAVIMGKTVTTELAYFTPGKTRNPHNPEHTPGGSSSGSAAAVAAGMVPLAVGSQTNGSVIRPAAFCGVVGFKPTHGAISRHGVMGQSRTLDTLGVFARSVADAALLGDALMAFDSRDPDMRAYGRPNLAAIADQEPPATPKLAFAKTPVWDKAEPDTRDAFAELTEALGDTCETIDLPALFERGHAAHRAINVTEMAYNFDAYYRRGKDKLSPMLVQAIEEGQRCLALDYARAMELRGALNAALDEIFDAFDAIVTPAAPGPAPKGLETTGDPAFCTLWTLCGTPAISLPLLTASNDLPMGVQLVGRRGDDARLLRTARWLTEKLGAQGQKSAPE
jgi:Asp-tRNA(Asn)/Glu-tRNA(Gln) amidotransferase A subunit family amidase